RWRPRKSFAAGRDLTIRSDLGGVRFFWRRRRETGGEHRPIGRAAGHFHSRRQIRYRAVAHATLLNVFQIRSGKIGRVAVGRYLKAKLADDAAKLIGIFGYGLVAVADVRHEQVAVMNGDVEGCRFASLREFLN